MGMTVWKYSLTVQSRQAVDLPAGAKIIKAHEQHGEICIWAWVDTDAPKGHRTIWVVGTGHEAPDYDRAKHIDSVLMQNGLLVFHVFEEVDDRSAA